VATTGDASTTSSGIHELATTGQSEAHGTTGEETQPEPSTGEASTTGEGSSTTGEVPTPTARVTSEHAKEKDSSSRASGKDEAGALSPGGLIGVIVAGCICGAAVIAGAIYVIRKRMQQAAEPTMQLDDLVI